jgi:potassium-transporting ATPase KdpC subunit
VVAQIRRTFVTLFLLILITGVVYPLLITGIGQLFFPSQANGSLIQIGDSVVGSRLIGQANPDLKYFQPRPSAINYQPLPSSGSNLGPTSQTLQEQTQQRDQDLRALYNIPTTSPIPADLLFASGSGLDPHISPAAAQIQVGRVAQERGLTKEQVSALVEQYTETAQFGILGSERVNVLLLNLALDGLK